MLKKSGICKKLLCLMLPVLMLAALCACGGSRGVHLTDSGVIPYNLGYENFGGQMPGFVYGQEGCAYNLPFRLYVPADYDSAKAYPVVVFLHGLGEQGIDNDAQLVQPQSGIIGQLLKPENQKKYPCLIVAPQFPEKAAWTFDDSSSPELKEEAPASKMVMGILNRYLAQNYHVDKSRIYLTGISMGGYGTWSLLARYPDVFAAAIPVSGGANESIAPAIAGTPIWAVHSVGDEAVSVEESRRVVNAVKAVGGNIRYTEYTDKTHSETFNDFYAQEPYLDWLFAQHR